MSVDQFVRVVYWNVRYINRQTREMDNRILRLDESLMTDSERDEFFYVCRKNLNDPQLVKFRRFFIEDEDKEGEEDAKVNEFHTVCILGYFEDEEGRGLDEIGLMQILSGQESPIILGNSRSVTRLGPANMLNKDAWTLKKANDIAHFIQLVVRISSGTWLKSEMSLKTCGDSSTLAMPNGEATDSTILAIRQFLEKRDDAFNVACNHYFHHVSDVGRKAWVQAEQTGFEQTRNSSFPLKIDGLTNEQLLEIHAYGSERRIHRSPNQKDLPEKYRELKQKHGDKFLFAIGIAMKNILRPVFNVAPVIAQDYRHWISVEGCLDSNANPINELFG